MQTVIEYKIRKLAPFCWGTFALVDQGAPTGGLAVYSISTEYFPTRQQVEQITTAGKMMPPVVAAHYFPEVLAPASLALAA